MGKDERFHRSLKLDVLRTQTFADLRGAARAFTRWRRVYNHERPHGGIGCAVPADRYAPSPRRYRDAVTPFDYGPGAIVRRVQHGGEVFAFGRTFRVPKAFHTKQIVFKPTEQDGLYAVCFRTTEIARLDRKTGRRYPPNLSTMSPNACP